MVSNNAVVRQVREKIDSTRGWSSEIWGALHLLRDNFQSVSLQGICDVEVGELPAVQGQELLEHVSKIDEISQVFGLLELRDCVHFSTEAIEEFTVLSG